uniref:C-type lectin domain-containing protein n=1 Tax=Electrophorus electricus TaxID=8005 RepID=A0AAY5ET73_ELEEL
MVGPAHVPLAALIVPFGLALLALAPLALPLLALALLALALLDVASKRAKNVFSSFARDSSALISPEGGLLYGKCYYFSTYKKTWTASRDACVAEGADLVIITSTEEAPVKWLSRSLCINVSLQVWVWSDESNYTYNDWGPGEPNNIGSDNCVQLYNNYSDKWNDAGCNYTCPFVCYKSDAIKLT